MRRRGQQLTLSTEHRAAPSQEDIPLQLTQSGSALALSVTQAASAAAPPAETPPLDRVRQALGQLTEPASVQQVRQLCTCALLRCALA